MTQRVHAPTLGTSGGTDNGNTFPQETVDTRRARGFMIDYRVFIRPAVCAGSVTHAGLHHTGRMHAGVRDGPARWMMVSAVNRDVVPALQRQEAADRRVSEVR